MARVGGRNEKNKRVGRNEESKEMKKECRDEKRIDE